MFAPKRRSRPFQVPLEVSLAGARSLSTLRGSCVGVEVKLARDDVDFGAVTLGSRVTRPVLLQNTGDVGATFAFDARAFGPDFSLFPRGIRAAEPRRDARGDVPPDEITDDARVDRAECRWTAPASWNSPSGVVAWRKRRRRTPWNSARREDDGREGGVRDEPDGRRVASETDGDGRTLVRG